ncbi:proton-coupled folate transporter-like [Saccostrea echinata]|uniref:proton-coupled folate transporter-like n=1 Tax=Saccostrea echinata TaxID=191078 RepID=UPI002A7F62F7|nr:proton-coupled folate transporter-like [Saccostrea echinata]
MESRRQETEEGYLRKFFPLCIVEFFFFLAYIMGFFIAIEYGHDKFRESLFPNQTNLNTTDKSHCETNTSSESYQNEQEVQRVVSEWSVYINLAQGIPLIFASIVFSPLSDSVGRKIFLFIGGAGVCIKQFLMTLAIAFDWNIYLFVAFTFIEGSTGSWVALLAITFSIMSDISSGQSRSFLIAAISFVFGVGYSVGNFIPGYAIEALGYTYAMAMSSSVCFVSVIGICFMPESLPPSRRSTVQFHCLTNLKEMLQFYIKEDKSFRDSKRWKYIVGLSAFAFIMLARLGASFELLYLIDSPFCFNPVKLSLFETLKSVLSEIIILAGIKLMQQCFRDEIIAFIGTISSLAYYILFGMAPSEKYLYIAAVVGAIGMCSIPMIRAIMSKMTPVNKQGTLFGSIAIIENICNLSGSVLGTALYSATVSYYRGMAYLVLAGCMSLALILLLILVIFGRGGREKCDYEPIPTSETAVVTSKYTSYF